MMDLNGSVYEFRLFTISVHEMGAQVTFGDLFG
jgi:hypothetical protein